MRANLLGYEDVDFIDKKTGDRIQGINLYIFIKDPTGNTTGYKGDKIFIKNEEIITINLLDFVGKEIEIEYGPKNKCYGISA